MLFLQPTRVGVTGMEAFKRVIVANFEVRHSLVESFQVQHQDVTRCGHFSSGNVVQGVFDNRISGARSILPNLVLGHHLHNAALEEVAHESVEQIAWAKFCCSF